MSGRKWISPLQNTRLQVTYNKTSRYPSLFLPRRSAKKCYTSCGFFSASVSRITFVIITHFYTNVNGFWLFFQKYTKNINFFEKTLDKIKILWYYIYRCLYAIVCRHVFGIFRGEVPPVPIPNTEVKLAIADNTWLETVRKDRSMPKLYRKTQIRRLVCLFFVAVSDM